MKSFQISCEQTEHVVVFRLYANQKTMRRAYFRESRRHVKNDRGRFRSQKNADGAMISFPGYDTRRDVEKKEFCVCLVLLHQDKPLFNLLDDVAHECAHVGHQLVKDGEMTGALCLLKKDSKARREKKKDEARATIAGCLTGIFYQWVIELGCTTDPEQSNLWYNPAVWPDDLWRAPRRDNA